MADAGTLDRWNSVNDVLDFAIDREQDAVDFYTDLAQRAENTAMRSVFDEFAGMEKGHKVRLEKIKSQGSRDPSTEKVPDLKIGDYLVDVEPKPDMSYQDTLTVAIKREQSACSLYTDLAAATEDEDIKRIMVELAGEEAKHKLRFETEYDEYVLKEN